MNAPELPPVPGDPDPCALGCRCAIEPMQPPQPTTERQLLTVTRCAAIDGRLFVRHYRQLVGATPGEALIANMAGRAAVRLVHTVPAVADLARLSGEVGDRYGRGFAIGAHAEIVETGQP